MKVAFDKSRFLSASADLIERIGALGLDEVERRIGREIDDQFAASLISIEHDYEVREGDHVRVGVRVVPSSEFDRVLLALG